MVENSYKFPIVETIEAAWNKVKGSKATMWAIIGLIILNVFVFGIIGGLLQAFVGDMVSQISTVIGTIVLWLLTWGLIYIGIQRAKDLPIDYTMFKGMFNWNLFFKMLGVYLVQALAIAITLIILLPGFIITSNSLLAQIVIAIAFIIWYVVFLYVLVRMYLAKAYVLDTRVNSWEAIKLSVAATKGNVLRIFGFLILCVLVFLLSVIPLGIGLIWSLPFMFIAYGLLYQRIAEKK